MDEGVLRTDLADEDTHPANTVPTLKLVWSIPLKTLLRAVVGETSGDIDLEFCGDLVCGELIGKHGAIYLSRIRLVCQVTWVIDQCAVGGERS